MFQKGHDALGQEMLDFSHVNWSPTILPKFALVIQRSGTRRITNIEKLAQTLAKELGLAVLLFQPHYDIPEALQVYLFLAASLVVGMHGGAWGSALVLSTGQAAVEVLPNPSSLTARHIVTVGGAAYESSLCLDCSSASKDSGRANVKEVVKKAQHVLCEAEMLLLQDQPTAL